MPGTDRMTDYAQEFLDISCVFRSRDAVAQRYTAVVDTTLRVRAGEVRVFGRPLAGINTRAGYMFQTGALMSWSTALQNVMLGLQYRGLADVQARTQAMEWLQRVGLGEFADS